MYMSSIPAGNLCRRSDVSKGERSAEDAEGIQRRRDTNRIERIRCHVEASYPFGEFEQVLRETHTHFKISGLPPTATAVNILTKDAQRKGKRIRHLRPAGTLEDCDRHGTQLPDQGSLADCDLRPLDAANGQQRLRALGGEGNLSDFDAPVAALHGLGAARQACLFRPVKISPVRTNPGHALGPCLSPGTQDDPACLTALRHGICALRAASRASASRRVAPRLAGHCAKRPIPVRSRAAVDSISGRPAGPRSARPRCGSRRPEREIASMLRPRRAMPAACSSRAIPSEERWLGC